MSSKFDAPLGPSDTNLSTQYNVDTISDPFAGFRNDFWHRTSQTASSSSGLLSSFSNPQNLLGDALTATGLASRMIGESPLSLEMSWGLTAAGRVLTAYTHSDQSTPEPAAAILPSYMVPTDNQY